MITLKHLGALILLGLPATGLSQSSSLNSSVAIGVTNNGFTNFAIETGGASADSSTGQFVQTSDFRSFDGLNRDGNSDQLTFSGLATAQATYGQVRTSAQGTLTNSFYNSDNPVYYNSDTGEINPEGTPDRFISFGQGRFVDFLTYSSNSFTLTANVTVTFLYQIDGFLTGDAGFFSIFVQADADSDLISFSSDGGSTQIHEIWSTKPFTIGSDFSIQKTATILSQFDNFSTEFYPDGATVPGSSDFSSTATLVGMSLFAENGDRISDFTVTSLSGTNYPIPEPGTYVLLGLASVICFLKRAGTACLKRG